MTMTSEERKKYGGLVEHKAGAVVDFDECTYGTLIFNVRTRQVGVYERSGILQANCDSDDSWCCIYSLARAKEDTWISFGVNLAGVFNYISDHYNAK